MKTQAYVDLGLRFWLKVYSRGDCWEWRGCRNYSGYGVAYWDYKMQTGAHRVAHLLTKGDIPSGLTIDHRCNHRWCVRPSHMALMPIWENARQGTSPTAQNARKERCAKGHEPNWAHYPATAKRAGHRKCRTCTRERDAERPRRLITPEQRARYNANRNRRRALGQPHG